MQDERTRAYKRLADVSKKIGEFRHHQQFGPLATSYTMSRVLDCFNASKARYTIFFSHACGTRHGCDSIMVLDYHAMAW